MYICDSVPDDVTIDQPREWEWTTKPPTQEGWYWTNHKTAGIHIVDFSKEAMKQMSPNGALVWSEDVTHWLGPLPVPEPPQK